jgi:membrane-associated protease RseP (regulator of RpoE activity)
MLQFPSFEVDILCLFQGSDVMAVNKSLQRMTVALSLVACFAATPALAQSTGDTEKTSQPSQPSPPLSLNPGNAGVAVGAGTAGQPTAGTANSRSPQNNPAANQANNGPNSGSSTTSGNPTPSAAVAANAPAPLGLNFSATQPGLNIIAVGADSLAHSVGLQIGDQIVSVNGTPVRTPADFQSLVERNLSGYGPITLSVLRNGKLSSFLVSSATAATGDRGSATAPTGEDFLKGLTFDNAASPAPTDRLKNTLNGTPGLRLTNVAPNSWADRAGLKPNDFLVSVNGAPVGTSPAQFAADVQEGTDIGGNAELLLVRNGRLLTLRVTGAHNAFRPANAEATLGSQPTDFRAWADDFSELLRQAEGNYKKQLNELGQMNDRITVLRNSVDNSLGTTADQAKIGDSLRAIRSELEIFRRHVDGVLSLKVDSLLESLDHLGPQQNSAAPGPIGTDPNRPAPR